ncbi:ORF4 [Bovine adenovirus 3]|uniref:Uncharacterized protein n=1 Tax=Bovine adenovirus B serotype 3 TaxID=10510 RepID=A0A9W3HR57_ADEB3|nr:hypothetical protein BAdVBgp26 [Bovine adenovirus 3]AAD09738.1 ORF4 [Bovine adenovirus 3]
MVDQVRCPALGWSYSSYKIWMQAFSVVTFGLWLQHRDNPDLSVRLALLDLYYLSSRRQRQKEKSCRLSKTALWQKCFFMYCKYKRTQKLLQWSSECKVLSPSASPITTCSQGSQRSRCSWLCHYDSLAHSMEGNHASGGRSLD